MCDCDQHPYDIFFEEYLASDPHNRIDMLTTTFNVNELLIVVDNHACVLSHLRLNRSTVFESTKEVTGVPVSSPTSASTVPPNSNQRKRQPELLATVKISLSSV